MKIYKFLLLLLCIPSIAATYYIDFSSGDDTAAGTSTGTAWKTIPGTRNLANTDYVSSDYGGGTISTVNKVPAGTVFKLKSGTTHDSSIGGRIRITPVYYDNTATMVNPITFQRNSIWGSGSVTFDGSGIGMTTTGESLIEIVDLGGITFDGVSTNGIIIQDSERIGIMQYLNTITEASGCTILNCKFYRNGTDYSALSGSGAGSGQFYAGGGSGINRTINGTLVNGCEFNGADLYFNGTMLGQTDQRITNAFVLNCTSHNHPGSDATDVGIGFKGQNSQITYSNCFSYLNDKGLDNGDEDSADNWEIVYKIISCTVYSNTTLGIGLSGSARATQTTNVNWYVINSVIYGNTNGPGVKAYASPYNLYVTGCTFHNGLPNLMAHHDYETNNLIRIQVWNNILYKPRWRDNYSWGNFDLGYWKDTWTNTYTLTMNYNSYVKFDPSNNNELFSAWGSYGGDRDNHLFIYGENGPGQSSGTWYAWNGWGNDVNSVGSGCAITNLPPFRDANTRNYILTTNYPGLNLSGQSWYIEEMGKDRAGNSRVEWSIGAYEYVPRLHRLLWR